MDRDLKEVIGTMMRVLGGEAISRREVEDLAFEATGDLQAALNEAFIKLLEFAYDCDTHPSDHRIDVAQRAGLQQSLDKIVRLADGSKGQLRHRRSDGIHLSARGL